MYCGGPRCIKRYCCSLLLLMSKVWLRFLAWFPRGTSIFFPGVGLRMAKMELCNTFVECSLLCWRSTTLLTQTACCRGNGWKPWGGLRNTATRVCIFSITGEMTSCSHPHNLLCDFNMQEVSKLRCEKSLQLRDMRCVSDSYASHLIFVP